MKLIWYNPNADLSFAVEIRSIQVGINIFSSNYGYRLESDSGDIKMQLRLHRSQRSSGIVSSKIVFTLSAQVDLTPDEIENVRRYKMGKEIVFSKERVTPDFSGENTWRGIARNLAFAATVLTITINDLVKGRVIECKDILEMLAIEEQIHSACRTFKEILQSAAYFDGEEVIEI